MRILFWKRMGGKGRVRRVRWNMVRVERLRGWLTSMRQTKSFWVLGFYLLLILVFAAVYWQMPGHFYHTTVQHEKSLKDDARELEADLERDIIDNYHKSWGTRLLSESGFVVDVDRVKVRELKYAAGNVQFRMELPFRMRSDPRPMHRVADILVTTQAASSWDWHIKEYGGLVEKNIDVKVLTAEQIPIRNLFMVKRQDLPINSSTLGVSEDLNNKIIAYAGAFEGFPGGSSGSFGRMLYLSAMTITTVGYGWCAP